jgi:hypothetical protein
VRRLVLLTLALALVGLGLTACMPPPAATPTAVTTVPPLFPAFQTDVTDYVIRCEPQTPVEVHVTTPNGTLVSVDGRYPRSGLFGELVTQRAGERFTIAVTTPTPRTTTPPATTSAACRPTSPRGRRTRRRQDRRRSS